MPLLHIIILALVQGITEFLPISSSGHLVLVHEALDHQQELSNYKQTVLMDVAVHVGTLFSVLIYFRKDVWAMLLGLGSLCKRDESGLDSNAKLLLAVIIGSIPVIIAGFLVHCFEPSWLRLVEVMAWMTLIFGIVLWWVDARYPVHKTLADLNLKEALMIGAAQALALVPGTSRSGITMTAARALGYSRSEAAHFSLLLAIVAIAGAGTLAVKDLMMMQDVALTFDAVLAAMLAFISGWIAIALMMKWLARASFAPFAIYRIGLGIVLLVVIYGVV